MLLLAWLGQALAADVYLNGVKASGLTNFELKDVNVRIDERGNIYIDAPRYSIEVVSPPTAPAPVAPQPAAPVAPAVPQPAVPVTPQPAAPVVAPPEATVGPPEIVAPVALAPVAPPAVAPERYWLVSEDNGSTGHQVQVLVNGVLAATAASGAGDLLLDVGPWLTPGPNIITLNASATGPLGGGVFNVFLGTGSNDQGTLNLDPPQISFSRRSTDEPAGTSQQFTLVVP